MTRDRNGIFPPRPFSVYVFWYNWQNSCLDITVRICVSIEVKMAVLVQLSGLLSWRISSMELPPIQVGWMLIFWYNQTVYILPLNYCSLLATINTSWVDVDILIQSNCLHPASQLLQVTCYHQYELGGCWYFDTIKLSTSCLSTIPVYLLPSIRVGWMLIFWYNQTVYTLPPSYSSLLATINASWVDVDILIQSNCLHPASTIAAYLLPSTLFSAKSLNVKWSLTVRKTSSKLQN